MGEYAEIQWRQDMRRGMRCPPPDPDRKVGRNPIVRHCPICGKGTRAVGCDQDQGLREHLRVKHKVRLADLEAGR